ncbi:MAG: prolyl oligopeptidase family serine peptidase [Alphaproteobacteria bacterium]|nr:prolyl oligopeptidase family serine peptidase [Alphaproteobacteria bacterium]
MTKIITIFAVCFILALGVAHAESANPPSEYTIPSKYGAQKASGYKAEQEGRPLVVNLHTWDYDYTQQNPLGYLAFDKGFNYIHPDFQGKSNHPDACLSDKVITNIDEAIDWALENWKADPEKIYLVGFSGGAYTALGYYFKGKHKLAGTFAWAPISDLERWFYESLYRRNQYAKDILECTSGSDEILEEEMKRRSPLYMEYRENGPLKLYAGSDDGMDGNSVPISHSLEFYNKIVAQEHRIPDETLRSLLVRGVPKTGKMMGNRDIFYEAIAPNAQILIYHGGHEFFPDIALRDLIETSGEP